jgi:hypothetical protein
MKLLLSVVLVGLFTAIAYFLFVPCPRDADMAGTMLSGIDMAHGNWRLAGWWRPIDNFITFDIPLYALLTRIFGIRPIVLYYTPALIWGATGGVAVLLALRGRKLCGSISALAIIITLVVLPITAAKGPAWAVSQSPFHIGTLLLVMLAFLALDATMRGARQWQLAWLGLAYFMLILAATIGDPLTIVVGAAPVIASSIVWARGHGQRGLHMAIGGATIAAILTAILMLEWNISTGGFQISHAVATATAGALPLHQAGPVAFVTRVLRQSGTIARWLCGYLGASIAQYPLQSPSRSVAAILFIRAPLCLLFAASIVTVARRAVRVFMRGAGPSVDYIDLLLWFALAANISSILLLGAIIDEASSRLLVPAFLFGALLLARNPLPGRLVATYVKVACVASVAFTLYWITKQGAAPVMASPPLLQLIEYLDQHAPIAGFGPYYPSSMTTILTSERVTMGAIWRDPAGKLKPFPWNASAQSFRDLARPRQGTTFFVLDTGDEAGLFHQSDVEALMGPPQSQDHVGPYIVDFYDANNAHLAQLAD